MHNVGIQENTIAHSTDDKGQYLNWCIYLSVNLVILDSDNCLAPVRHQAITCIYKTVKPMFTDENEQQGYFHEFHFEWIAVLLLAESFCSS